MENVKAYRLNLIEQLIEQYKSEDVEQAASELKGKLTQLPKYRTNDALPAIEALMNNAIDTELERLHTLTNAQLALERYSGAHERTPIPERSEPLEKLMEWHERSELMEELLEQYVDEGLADDIEEEVAEATELIKDMAIEAQLSRLKHMTGVELRKLLRDYI